MATEQPTENESLNTDVTEVEQEVIDFRDAMQKSVQLKQDEFNKFKTAEDKLALENFLQSKKIIESELSGLPDVDILPTLAIWGAKQLLNEDLTLNDIKDTLNKIAECNAAIAAFLKTSNMADKDLLQNTLIAWAKKEVTNPDYKAKYR